ncbi:MAG: DUF3050 domain-containing protein [Bacteroidetes bacterium]|nr:DUF3050 domain-containing protein [Bacteroidota bacterium]
MHSQVALLNKKIAPVRAQLLAHSVYSKINNLEGLKNFTQYHVFAVWDFMSLLKSLQIGLTSVQLPWVPVGTANTRYLINEIVLGEESDVDEHDNRVSHFELYVKAMRQMGATTNFIDALLHELSISQSIEMAIEQTDLPTQVKSFLQYTFEIAQHAPLHVKAAVFTFGREDLIPDMFTKILNKIYADHPDQVSTFKYYIERHIEVDGGHHSHLALEMVAELCGNDTAKWEEATNASLKALEMRALLWDVIFESITD